MVPEWQQATVVGITQLTANTFSFDIELDSKEGFHFVPGQFVTLDLPIHEQRNKRWRSYSIASAPTANNRLTLLIAYIENGLASTYFQQNMQIGTRLTLRGPQGVFTLPATLDKPLWLICTGTGLAPFLSMADHILAHNLPHNGIHLLFGTRTRQDLLYYERLTALQSQLNGFHYYPVLSRETWGGLQGYVHQVYMAQCADAPPACFMLCGWKAMIDDARNNLKNLGYTKQDIHFELYG